ncbi:structural protein [Proteus mirabilis]|uniref:structural protein n=1 Tax=Proteus mirabilis TaxID=584 RepID=UPI00202507C0|nr:structural protein [Proteus mirabilis]MCL8627091.1 structural protein [Proteus mirabilis]MCL8633902.1 structural protein [Proteus mirabilis]
MTKPARGERNNNPGNIDYNPRNKWKGLVGIETGVPNPRFCVFESPEYGIRAIYKLTQTYQRKYGLNSVSAIINKYAPPNENNTTGYINRAAKDIGVSVNEPIDVTSKPVAIALATAIVGVELGYQPYSQKVFEDAWLLL